MRVHRLSGLVLALLVVFAVLAGMAAEEAVQESEARLLRDRTAQVASLLESLGSGYEARMASVASIAAVTDADPEQFRTAVTGVAGDDLDDAAAGGWALLRRDHEGFRSVERIGNPVPIEEAPAAWTAGLEAAASGEFRVLGFHGEGFDRRLGLAVGRLGVAGDVVVYTDVSLLGATGDAANGTDAGEALLSDVAIDVFIGDAPDPDQRLLAFGEPDRSRSEEQVVEVAGVRLYLVVAPTSPLVGALASRLPWMLALGASLLGLALAAVVELGQRRRDDALRTVHELEEQNERLDKALADQRAAEEARSRLEEELRQSQRLEAIGQLAGGVAHDFNNVLAAILSYADLAADGVTDVAARADLEAIQDAARRGAGLTRQLLQFSRRTPGDLEPVAVNDRVLEVVGMLGRTLGEDRSLRCDLVDAPMAVLADPAELDQILLNLVVNARDAVGPGGVIEVSTAAVELDPTEAALHPGLEPGPYVRLAVTDDGTGMAPEVVEHAFEPFFTTKGRGHGTGLGLSTVYGIVQRLGGYVAVRSVEGVGTSIEVLLPAVEPTGMVAVDEVREVVASPIGSGRVLVVEDEAPLREALVRMLERAGYEVVAAADGADALGRIHEHFDLLLTDVVMPGPVTGADVAAGLRSTVADLPVVYMTGYSDALLDGVDLGPRHHTLVLIKPFSEAELRDALAATMGQPA
jgi:signal transduction histidine kinase/CheY-like chemotaxis protein